MKAVYILGVRSGQSKPTRPWTAYDDHYIGVGRIGN